MNSFNAAVANAPRPRIFSEPGLPNGVDTSTRALVLLSFRRWVQPANNFLLDFKRVYQNEAVEPYLIFVPLAVHMIASVVRAAIRPPNGKGEQQTVKERNLHRNLGWALMPLISFHFFGTRLGPWLKLGKPFADKIDLSAVAAFGAFPVVVPGWLPRNDR